MISIEPVRSVKRAWPLGVLLAVALTVYWPLVCHPTDLLVGVQNGGRNDLTAQFLGFRMFPRAAIAQGSRPLWNPWMLLGQPWIGNPQSAALYPPNWLAIASGHPAAWGWLMVAHQLWAGCGAFLFARRLGCGPAAAMVGGAIVVAAPFYLAQIGEGHLNQVCLAAWIPWAFWAFENWRHGARSARWMLPVILALAVFCGHVQEALYVALALTLFCSGEILRDFVAARPIAAMRRMLGWVAVGAATAGLTAVEVAPIYRQMQNAVRGRAFSVEAAGQISVGWDHVWQLLDPHALGGPEDYHGSGMFFWETLFHFGLWPLLLAVFAAVAGRRRPGVVGWTALAVFSILFAFGPRTPVYTACHLAVPGVALFRAPSRMLFIASVLIAALAAIGAHELQTTLRKTAARLWWGALGLGSLIGLGLTSLVWTMPVEPSVVERAGLQPAVWAWLAVGCLAACLMTSSRRATKTLGAVLAIGAIAAQLGNLGHELLRTVPAEYLLRDNELVTRLSQETGYERVLVRHEHLTDEEALQHRICKLTGYDPAPLIRTVGLFEALTSGRNTPERMLGFVPVNPQHWNKQLLDLLGVRWMVTDADFGELAGWTKIAAGAVPAAVAVRGSKPAPVPYVLYRNNTSFPRAFVLGRVELFERNGSLKSQLAEWNPRETVLLERDVLPPESRTGFRAAEITEYAADRVVLNVTELDQPGYLVLSDAWFPGWSAQDDSGRKLDVLCADSGLRAIALRARTQRITMTFKPPLWEFGALVSMVSAGLLILGAMRPSATPHPA